MYAIRSYYGYASGEDRRVLRFDGIECNVRKALTQRRSGSRQSSSRTDCRYENIEFSFGVTKNLSGCGLSVDFRIMGILKLLQDGRVGSYNFV